MNSYDNQIEELEKCKDFEYYFKNYTTFKNPNGTFREPNDLEVKLAIAYQKAIEVAKIRVRAGRSYDYNIFNNFPRKEIIEAIENYNKLNNK